MWMKMNLQDAMTPNMEQLIFFHDHTIMILIMITVMVSYMIITMMMNKFINRFLLEGQFIEFIWTIMPALTLIFIALPSLHILYLIDEMNKPMITIKVIGHQWYWSYEYSDFKNIEFDSYMKPSNELNMNEFRLLDVDNRVILPVNTQIRVLVTAADVLHSWALPNMGIKIDATPGRLNQGSMLINQPTISYGQCSEICGANHSFMPIVIESTTMKNFIKWLNK
uniref:Cytochrome c oxidase subunit 2 n=1 Tax=Malcus setosus TaxID=2813416 RepID=A0A8T9VU39_9HEMI|nr:cytochrome c oxidase subunit II [Malcus setosus]UPI55275.1 cytochrome c oxidase subunit II [Malcus setosus]